MIINSQSIQTKYIAHVNVTRGNNRSKSNASNHKYIIRNYVEDTRRNITRMV